MPDRQIRLLSACAVLILSASSAYAAEKRWGLRSRLIRRIAHSLDPYLTPRANQVNVTIEGSLIQSHEDAHAPVLYIGTPPPMTPNWTPTPDGIQFHQAEGRAKVADSTFKMRDPS